MLRSQAKSKGLLEVTVLVSGDQRRRNIPGAAFLRGKKFLEPPRAAVSPVVSSPSGSTLANPPGRWGHRCVAACAGKKEGHVTTLAHTSLCFCPLLVLQMIFMHVWCRRRSRRDFEARKVCAPSHPTPMGLVLRLAELVHLRSGLAVSRSHKCRPPFSLARPPKSEAIDLNFVEDDEAGGGVVIDGIAGDRAAGNSKQVGYAFSSVFHFLRVANLVCVLYLWLVPDHSPHATFRAGRRQCPR